MRDEKASENGCRCHAVGKAVVCRRFHGGGGDLPTDLEVVEGDIRLDENGAEKNDDRQYAEYGRDGRDDLLHGRFAELKADENDDHGDDQSRYVFDPSVSERVVTVGLLSRHAKADERDDGGARVGQVVEGIRHDGDRAAYESREEFNAEKNDVQNDSQYTAQRAVGVSDLGRSGVFMVGNEDLC